MKLIPCLHRDNVRRGAVIVCPGGGYGVLAPYEGEPIAQKLYDASFQAFTLYYSCAPARYPTARDELFEAIRYVSNAGILELARNQDKSGILTPPTELEDAILADVRAAGVINSELDSLGL